MNLSVASKWFSGVLTLAKGGFGADLSATGYGNLKQATNGAVVTSEKKILTVQYLCRWTEVTQSATTTETYLASSKGSTTKLDLSGYTQIRVSITRGSTTAVTGTVLRFRYSTSLQSAVTSMTQLGISGHVEVDVTTASTFTLLDWTDIATGARVDDVYIGCSLLAPSGTTTIGFGTIIMEFR